MTARIVITKATPLPSIVAGRATEQNQKSWSPELTAIRSCMHCKTVYLDAGRAGLVRALARRTALAQRPPVSATARQQRADWAPTPGDQSPLATSPGALRCH